MFDTISLPLFSMPQLSNSWIKITIGILLACNIVLGTGMVHINKMTQPPWHYDTFLLHFPNFFYSFPFLNFLDLGWFYFHTFLFLLLFILQFIFFLLFPNLILLFYHAQFFFTNFFGIPNLLCTHMIDTLNLGGLIDQLMDIVPKEVLGPK